MALLCFLSGMKFSNSLQHKYKHVVIIVHYLKHKFQSFQKEFCSTITYYAFIMDLENIALKIYFM